jgi:hypothetical protein
VPDRNVKERLGGRTWAQWEAWFCEWIEAERVSRSAPDQTAILLVDNAPTRANPAPLRLFQEHNLRVVTFPPLCLLHQGKAESRGEVDLAALRHP